MMMLTEFNLVFFENVLFFKLFQGKNAITGWHITFNIKIWICRVRVMIMFYISWAYKARAQNCRDFRQIGAVRHSMVSFACSFTL